MRKLILPSHVFPKFKVAALGFITKIVTRPTSLKPVTLLCWADHTPKGKGQRTGTKQINKPPQTCICSLNWEFAMLANNQSKGVKERK